MKKLKISGYIIAVVAFVCCVFAIILLATGISVESSVKDDQSFAVIILALANICCMIILIGTLFLSGTFVLIFAKSGNKNAVLKLVLGIILSVSTMISALGCFAVSGFAEIAPRNSSDALTLSCCIAVFAVALAELAFSIVNFVFKRKNAAVERANANTASENVPIASGGQNPYDKH